MKLLQYNITSLNISLEKLWGYQKEKNYDAIFLQEPNYTAGKPLAYFKYWKSKMFTNFQNKAMGFGVRTLVSKCFQRGSLTQGPRDNMERNANAMEKSTCWEYLHSTYR